MKSFRCVSDCMSGSYASKRAMHSHTHQNRVSHQGTHLVCLFVCSLVRKAKKRFVASFSWHWVPCARIHQLNLVDSWDWTWKQHAQEISKNKKNIQIFYKINLSWSSSQTVERITLTTWSIFSTNENIYLWFWYKKKLF